MPLSHQSLDPSWLSVVGRLLTGPVTVRLLQMPSTTYGTTLGEMVNHDCDLFPWPPLY